jgi:hypothetical protein
LQDTPQARNKVLQGKITLGINPAKSRSMLTIPIFLGALTALLGGVYWSIADEENWQG